ncbi:MULTISPECIES: ABC transporter ATP-binding protein [Brachybacterium]|uniref:Iron ABC transporter ATP-binding protein n=1 Tax=Brachybacterium alimentarium TaxID=47845 RepID=A0A2A3YG09_9MICO|nr:MULTISPECIES: ABC transporter ATP-binding protein [Brachybacterium]PCC31982.1 iron ABC transporter ATP-binding protein [Brachybacterium alimentarium]PCC38198.1 iron ABC transporter ATP-binding protein [Brachybacterium alimentarium]RCS66973.1 ABC transporter ATP-binding protein [Brachybacterium sp. JB7]RCS71724.1 ABC transporter ATP-binding protein [Brachybacterium alimentarium]RCS74088.1 ABC transporter ATP-binding protein [Brachybacterium alimentarium]
MSVAAASLTDVVVRRSGRNILDSVSLEIAEGERWAVLGPNGAGKSTLVGLLSARMHPTAGTVEIIGEQLGKVDIFELRPMIGLASQELADTIPVEETAENVVVTAGYGVVGRWREQYDELDLERARTLLAAFGVGDLSTRMFGTLSTGERKRVLAARALMTDPELLLLDEPAAGLDLGGRESLVRTLGRLAKDPATPVTVLVTHHVEEIPPGYTHVVLLREGGVVAAGPIEDTLTSQNLTRTFGLPLVVEQRGDRYTARSLSLD